jgi:diguanylate cyclase (GGDEF)-like protein
MSPLVCARSAAINPMAWRLRVNGDHDTTPMFQAADAEAPAQQAVPPAAAAGDQPTVASAELAWILASIGEACYEWDIATDVLAWSHNVASVVPVADLAEISSGRLFARLLDGDNIQTRFDAVMHSVHRDEGRGVPYQVEYCMRVGAEPSRIWFEDTGRWFGGSDGRPVRAHGVVRVINERHAQQERLAFLSRYDALTGEMNRWHLTDVLGEALQDSIRFRASCGFLLIAIDNLARINEAYGFDVADEVIAAVSKRIRARMRGGDSLGRFSGNKFGVVLKECTPEDIAIAADRFLAEVRDEVVQTATGPVAVTATIGGVAAPRHARTVQEVLARAQESLDAAKAKRRGSFFAYLPSVEREALRRENVRATDEIVTALNDRLITLAYEPVVDARSRQPQFYECLMRVRRADGTMLGSGNIIQVAERLGLIRLIDHRVAELVVAELMASPELKVSLNSRPPPPWTRTGGTASRRRCIAIPAPRSGWSSRSPRRRRSRTWTTRAASSPAPRSSAAPSPSTTSAPATPRSATCASSASTWSRSTARSCRT